LYLAITTSELVMEGFLTGGNGNDVDAAPALEEDMDGCFVPADRGYASDQFRRIFGRE
jgi:hypothetical protein